MPRYEFSEGASNKFWEITLEGTGFTTRWGKIGTDGQSKEQDFGSEDKAKQEYEKIIAEKVKKGYQLAGKGSSAPAASAKASAPPAKAKEPAKAPAPAAAAPVVLPKGTRRFEFVEGGSSKFWEISVEDETFTARWGKIGTDGQEKTQEFESSSEAKAEAKKLIAEKLKKGYQEVGGGSGGGSAKANPELEAAIDKNIDDPAGYLVYADWLQANAENVRGELIVLQKKGDQKAVDNFVKKNAATLFGDLAERVESEDITDLKWFMGFVQSATLKRADYDSDADVTELTEQFLALPVSRFIRSLTFGLTGYESDNDYTEVAEQLSGSGRGANLESVFFGDFVYPDDSEISWAEVGDLSSAWAATPKLRSLRIQGGAADLGTLNLPELRSFHRETGGLATDEMKSIATAKWPKLESLELWFGQDQYGGDCTVKHVQPVLDATGLGALKVLKLKNCEFVDELIEPLAKSKILKQINELDLSMGVLTNEGAERLIKHAAAFKHLGALNLEDNFLSDESGEKIKAVLPKANIEEQKEDDPEYRYATVGE